MVFYFGLLQHLEAYRVGIILIFSLIGIAGSYGVAWFGIRGQHLRQPRAPRSRACAASRFRFTRSRCAPA
jgi:hypothetical protein